MQRVADRMRVYEFIVDISDWWHHGVWARLTEPARTTGQEALEDVVCTAMATDASLFMQELPVAMTFLFDRTGSEDIDIGNRLEEVWKSVGIPAQCPSSVVGPLTSIAKFLHDGEYLGPETLTALESLVQPNLHLSTHSESAMWNLCHIFDGCGEDDMDVSSPVPAVADLARALYMVNPDVFHYMYADVVGACSDGQEDLERCEWFWKACGFPGTCFPRVAPNPFRKPKLKTDWGVGVSP
jgi:hypothetical protein